MKIAGLDIGTTSVSGVIIDTETGAQIASRTVPYDTIVSGEPWMREQDAGRIIELCKGVLEEFYGICPDIQRIGLTGQMHGIVYLDSNGKLLGNLINWQDERGNLPYKEGLSYAGYLQKKTGCPMSTGFGLTTHFYNTVNHLVPEGSVKICTIMDYLAMLLCNEKEPCIHPSNAASLGLFDIPHCRFEEEKMREAGMDPAILPRLVKGEEIIGRTAEGIEVVIPIGDNQAGTFAMLKDPGDILINIGTSSQISMICDSFNPLGGLECRPYVGNRYLQLYAGLCGGISFAMLNRFLQDVCGMFGVEVSKSDVFEKMMVEAAKAYGAGCAADGARAVGGAGAASAGTGRAVATEGHVATGGHVATEGHGTAEGHVAAESAGTVRTGLSVSTLFRGKRSAPELRGSVTGINMDNFTPGNLILGFYEGVVDELYESFLAALRELPAGKGRLLLAGNALRSNELLRKICADRFSMETVLLTLKEEAALGCAYLAGSVK